LPAVICIPQDAFDLQTAQAPAGYRDAVLAKAERRSGQVCIDETVLADLNRCFAPRHRPPAVSRGLGDTVAKITHATCIAHVIHAISQATGIPCGCAERQEKWNKAVPYDTGKSAA
jgi:hypothetical protein